MGSIRIKKEFFFNNPPAQGICDLASNSTGKGAERHGGETGKGRGQGGDFADGENGGAGTDGGDGGGGASCNVSDKGGLGGGFAPG